MTLSHKYFKQISFTLHPPFTRSHQHENTCTNFRVSRMSVPELPSNISSPEETFQASLRRVYIIIDKLHSELTNSQERLQTLFNYMVSHYQNSKLRIQPQEVSGYDIFLSKITSQNIFVSADLDPDLDPVQGISQVFRKPSNIDPRTSRLKAQMRFVTLLSCDLEPDISKPSSRNIVI